MSYTSKSSQVGPDYSQGYTKSSPSEWYTSSSSSKPGGYGDGAVTPSKGSDAGDYTQSGDGYGYGYNQSYGSSDSTEVTACSDDTCKVMDVASSENVHKIWSKVYSELQKVKFEVEIKCSPSSSSGSSGYGQYGQKGSVSQYGQKKYSRRSCKTVLQISGSRDVECCLPTFKWCLKTPGFQADTADAAAALLATAEDACSGIVACEVTQSLLPMCMCVKYPLPTEITSIAGNAPTAPSNSDIFMLRTKCGYSGMCGTLPVHEPASLAQAVRDHIPLTDAQLADSLIIVDSLVRDILGQIRQKCPDVCITGGPREENCDPDCPSPRPAWLLGGSIDTFLCAAQDLCQTEIPAFKPLCGTNKVGDDCLSCEDKPGKYGQYDIFKKKVQQCTNVCVAPPEIPIGCSDISIEKIDVNNGQLRKAWVRSKINDQMWILVQAACKYFGATVTVKCFDPDSPWDICKDRCTTTILPFCATDLECLFSCTFDDLSSSGDADDDSSADAAYDQYRQSSYEAKKDACPEKVKVRLGVIRDTGKVMRPKLYKVTWTPKEENIGSTGTPVMERPCLPVTKWMHFGFNPYNPLYDPTSPEFAATFPGAEFDKPLSLLSRNDPKLTDERTLALMTHTPHPVLTPQAAYDHYAKVYAGGKWLF
jgi:hypothetical protein